MKNINESKNPTPKSNSKLTLEVLILIIVLVFTDKILKILDPIIFPKDIPTSFFDSAIKVTNNSGKEVPIATIVIPIAFSEKPNCSTKGAPLSTIIQNHNKA